MITSGIMKLQTSHGTPTTFHHGTPGFPPDLACKDEKQASFQVGDVVEFRGYKNPPVFRFVSSWASVEGFFSPNFFRAADGSEILRKEFGYSRDIKMLIYCDESLIYCISDISVYHFNISNHSISIGIIGFHIPQYSHMCTAWKKPSMTHTAVGESCEPRLVNLPFWRYEGLINAWWRGNQCLISTSYSGLYFWG